MSIERFREIYAELRVAVAHYRDRPREREVLF